MWPGTALVEDEVKNSAREIWIMTKEEAHYYKIKGEVEDGHHQALDEAENDEVKANEDDKINYDEAIEKRLREHEEELKSTKMNKTKILTEEQERHQNVINLLIYLLFLVLFTFVIFEEKDTKLFFYTRQGLINQLLMYPFPIESSNLMTFYDIQLPVDVKNFFIDTFAIGM